jgi:hypothetical protein
VGQGRRAGDDARAGGKPSVAFFVGPLADDGHIRACDVECADEPVNVPAERPPVGWHVCRID